MTLSAERRPLETGWAYGSSMLPPPTSRNPAFRLQTEQDAYRQIFMFDSRVAEHWVDRVAAIADLLAALRRH